ncbi:MAG TPA: hypothetical protein VJT15_17210 [Pyrinomonadaceae bacterium]|nr:hypothetical protein [Pyrinomonadaceae bacterium]
MSKLRVDFQEGFAHDEIDLRINGQERLQKEGVTTNPLLGLASSEEVDVPEGSVTIEIKIPTKNLAKTISLESSGSKYLGVSIANGRIEHIVSQNPFGYA